MIRWKTVFEYVFTDHTRDGLYKLLNLIFLNCELGSRLKKAHVEIFPPAGPCTQECPLFVDEWEGARAVVDAVVLLFHSTVWGQISVALGVFLHVQQ